jgi:hypothetical protein
MEQEMEGQAAEYRSWLGHPQRAHRNYQRPNFQLVVSHEKQEREGQVEYLS